MTQASQNQSQRRFQLFALVDKADTIYVNGVEAIEAGYGSYTDSPSGMELRLSTPDDDDYHFVDQEVGIAGDGTVLASTIGFTADDEPEQVTLRFTVERNLSPDDM